MLGQIRQDNPIALRFIHFGAALSKVQTASVPHRQPHAKGFLCQLAVRTFVLQPDPRPCPNDHKRLNRPVRTVQHSFGQFFVSAYQN